MLLQVDSIAFKLVVVHLIDAVNANGGDTRARRDLANQMPVHNQSHALRQLACWNSLWSFLCTYDLIQFHSKGGGWRRTRPSS